MQVPIILIALVLGFGAERSLAPGPISGTPDAQDTANQRTGSWVRHDDGAPPNLYSCRTESLQTSFSFENPPIEIEKNGLVMSENGTFFASIALRNVGSSTMDSLALVMEYLGEQQGETVFTFALGAVVPNGEQAFRSTFPAQSVDAMVAPLGPGASVRIQGTAHGIRIVGCPAAARVTRVRVQFSDGRSQDWSTSGWRLDPVVAYVPDVSDFKPNAVTAPAAVSAVLKIDSTGRVIEMVPSEKGQPSLTESLRKIFLRHLRFHPALLDGQPVGSEIPVLIRLHSQRSLEFPTDLDLRTPVTLIDFFPEKFPEMGWTISYGGLSGGSAIP